MKTVLHALLCVFSFFLYWITSDQLGVNNHKNDQKTQIVIMCDPAN